MMSQETLETRVARLEQQVSLLLRGRGGEPRPDSDAWKRTVGMFRGDPVVLEMIEESRRLRQEDRRIAREELESGNA